MTTTTATADTCPRCGLPEGWTLKLRVRLVLISLAVAFAAGVCVGVAL